MKGNSIELNEQRLDQFATRHLLVALTVGAVLFALLAPGIHRLGEKQQRSALLQVVIVLGIFGLVVVYHTRRWRRMVAKAGPLVRRFERKSSRYWFWFNASLLLAWNAANCWLQLMAAQEKDEFVLVALDPYALVLLASYLLIRGWWKINPRSIEVRQRGLVRDFRIVLWENINRTSWSGTPPDQLNLFLTTNFVNSLRIEPEQVAEFDALLAKRLGAASPGCA